MTTARPASPYASIAIVGLLFFIIGFFTWINGPLITCVRLAFDLNEVNAFLVLMVFYLWYFFLALPSSWILKRTGMKKGLALSLVVRRRARRRSASSPRSASIPTRWPACS